MATSFLTLDNKTVIENIYVRAAGRIFRQTLAKKLQMHCPQCRGHSFGNHLCCSTYFPEHASRLKLEIASYLPGQSQKVLTEMGFIVR